MLLTREKEQPHTSYVSERKTWMSWRMFILVALSERTRYHTEFLLITKIIRKMKEDPEKERWDESGNVITVRNYKLERSSSKNMSCLSNTLSSW